VSLDTLKQEKQSPFPTKNKKNYPPTPPKTRKIIPLFHQKQENYLLPYQTQGKLLYPPPPIPTKT
jgi:hypothetical protein